jgi:hypothetical protein
MAHTASSNPVVGALVDATQVAEHRVRLVVSADRLQVLDHAL